VVERKTISICIPVFNESVNLPKAVEAVERVFETELAAYNLEFVVTDNGSTDNTWEVVGQLAATRPNLRGYRFSRNFGYQNSVFTGLSLATGHAVVELDADLEDPPHVIVEFVKKWEAGFDVAYGVRTKRHKPWVLRFFFALFYRLLNRLSELSIPQDSGDFRLLDRKVVDVLKALPERNLYLRGLVSFLGFKQAAVLYERDARLSGGSKFRLMHYFVLAIDALTAFTKAPLRLIGVLGGILFAGSLVLATYYFFGSIFDGKSVPGFTTLVILTLFLHSVTFIFLGILGEYLSRVFDDSKKRPRVIIADAVHADDYPKYL
jgi:dolichol-phosphate mannosyltransferase